MSLTQAKSPPTYFAGFLNLHRRNKARHAGGSSAPISPNSSSGPLCLLRIKEGTPHPLPHCTLLLENVALTTLIHMSIEYILTLVVVVVLALVETHYSEDLR